ncbi:MAG: BspA family leucine-rich repeat surface protein [Lachnospiraceae bacterium]|nr:BspA family leucine-rich repeat surface protein [Lachnospiraceae bacterium]
MKKRVLVEMFSGRSARIQWSKFGKMKKKILMGILSAALLVAAVCLFCACGASGNSKKSPLAADENLLMSGAKQSEYVSTERVSVLANENGPVRSDVYSITFLDSLADAPEDAWDVSDAGDGRVLAWFEDSEEKWMYDLYIAGENGVNANPDSSELFLGYTNLKEINFNGCFYTDQVTDMYRMFATCLSLEELDVSSFDTKNVQDMWGMFEICESLKELDLSSFDTSCVEDMASMFCDCASLEKVNLDSFDTSSVTKMYFMFSDCSSLKSLDVGGFDTSSVTDMSDMFSGCSSLKSLDVGSFDTSSVTDMSYMFADCTSLKSLNISNFDLTGADTTGMFDGTDLEEHLNQVWTAGRIAVVAVITLVAMGIVVYLIALRKKKAAGNKLKG